MILNELVTNSFKYAFKDACGNINILLDKYDKKFHLTISDNGIGYDKNSPSNTLGLILVNILAQQQLKGELSINSTNGVNVQIKWNDDEK
mgnify:CR=1 FL=1